MRKTRIEIAKPDIIDLFDKLGQNILKRREIENILSQSRQFWRLSAQTRVNDFIGFLINQTNLEKIELQFPYRKEIRFLWRKATIFEVAMSLKPDSHFSHYTAMYLHGLTEQIPKTIYVNYEQPLKRRAPAELEQARIDSAFRRPVRKSSNLALYKEHRICILNGMYTARQGVIESKGPEGEKIFLTDIERTLIDITVRPSYAGGVFEVLKAYRMAKEKVSINKLAAMLKMINHIYPYHQAVGFYLDHAGVYKDLLINLLRKFDQKYDFYLTHEMKEMEYSKKWRLNFPKGL